MRPINDPGLVPLESVYKGFLSLISSYKWPQNKKKYVTRRTNTIKPTNALSAPIATEDSTRNITVKKTMTIEINKFFIKYQLYLE